MDRTPRSRPRSRWRPCGAARRPRAAPSAAWRWGSRPTSSCSMPVTSRCRGSPRRTCSRPTSSPATAPRPSMPCGWPASRASPAAATHCMTKPRPPSWPRAPNFSRIDPMSFTTPEPPFRFHPGKRPLLISMPHVGTYVPPQLAARFTDEARQVPDTDWHLERLYDFADELGASVLIATHSRYVVDLNRPPDGASLYPGQSVTGLCPVDSFDDTPLYAAGDVPG